MAGNSRAAKKRAKQKQKRDLPPSICTEPSNPQKDALSEPPLSKRIKTDTKDVQKDPKPIEEDTSASEHSEAEASDDNDDHDGCDESVTILPPEGSHSLVELVLSHGDMTAKQRSNCVMNFLLQPSGMTTDDFYTKIWERKPLLIQAKGSKHRKRFEGLLSLSSIRTMVEQQTVYYGKDLNVTRYEKSSDDGVKRRVTLDAPPKTVGDDVEYNRADPVRVWKLYNDGCTIRLLCPHKHTSTVHSLLSLLELEVGSMIGANAYLTPPRQSQGFAPHYDDIEAFCLQLEGKKRWKVYAPLEKQETLPRVSSEDYTEDDLRDVKPVMDIILEPGDILYMPRGWIHQACTLPSSKDEGHHSLHLTVSCMQQWAWADFLDILLPEALEAAANGESTALRKGLPRNFLDYMGSVYDNSSVPEILKDRDADDNGASNPREQMREAFRVETRKKIMRIAKEAIGMLDAACDQIGKRFLSDRLPPALTVKEKEMVDNPDKASEKVMPNTLCRIVRPGIARLALEDGKAVLYHCKDNSLVYHETPLSPMEFEMDDAPAIEQLLTTVEPRWICVNDLIHDSIEDKVGVAQALYDEGVLATAELAVS